MINLKSSEDWLICFYSIFNSILLR